MIAPIFCVTLRYRNPKACVLECCVSYFLRFRILRGIQCFNLVDISRLILISFVVENLHFIVP